MQLNPDDVAGLGKLPGPRLGAPATGVVDWPRPAAILSVRNIPEMTR
jgi:hypothetical protein